MEFNTPLSFQPQALQYVCNNTILKEKNRQEWVTKGRNIAAVIGGDSQAVSAEGRVVWTGLADITLSHVAHRRCYTACQQDFTGRFYYTTIPLPDGFLAQVTKHKQ